MHEMQRERKNKYKLPLVGRRTKERIKKKKKRKVEITPVKREKILPGVM